MTRRIAALLAAATLTSSCALVGAAPRCKGSEVIAHFEQVGDLVKNANVQSSDVQVGTIQDIELDGWQARVTMCLDPTEEIPADVKAVVRTTSLLGEKFIDLQVLSQGAPYLEDGDVLDVDQTGKASELEDVFAKLASILGTGNLEQLNRFTHAQATILRDNTGKLRNLLDRLHRFTGLLAERKGKVAASVDSLDAVARTLLDEQGILQDFLSSFADASGVLVDQKEGLESVLRSLDRFSAISVQLLRQTETGLNTQFQDLRPVLRTLVENSAKLREGLQTLSTFVEWFPQTMPGDYLQLDVCQALPEGFAQGSTCPQSLANDDPDSTSGSASTASSSVEYILNRPLGGRR